MDIQIFRPSWRKTLVPLSYHTGYGSGFSSIIASVTATKGDSQCAPQGFFLPVSGLRVSLDALQFIFVRLCFAIDPHDAVIAEVASPSRVNSVAGTSWRSKGMRKRLRVMGDSLVAFFTTHQNSSGKDFGGIESGNRARIRSDSQGNGGNGVYAKRMGLLPALLAYLIRQTKGPSKRTDNETAKYCAWTHKEPRQLRHTPQAPPSVGDRNMFHARFIHRMSKSAHRQGDADKLTGCLVEEKGHLRRFLKHARVEPANNQTERLPRLDVLWRKPSFCCAREIGYP